MKYWTMRDMIKRGLDTDLDAEVRVVNINDSRTEEALIEAGSAPHVTQLGEDEDGNVFIYYAGPLPGDENVEDD